VIHYPGFARFAHPASPSEVITHTRQEQRYYADGKGYSLGYQWLVTIDGDIIQSRGFDWANAANSPANGWSISIQLHCEGVGDDADEASPAQVAAVNQIIAEATRRAGRPLTVVGHRDTKPTSCPGAGIYRQIQAGVFRPDDTPTPPTPPDPTPTPPPTGDIVLHTVAQSGDGWWAIARRVYGNSDVAANAAALEAANPGVTIHPGDTISVPGRAVR